MIKKHTVFSSRWLRNYIIVFPIILILAAGCKKDTTVFDDKNEIILPVSNNLPIDSALFVNGQSSTVVVLGSSTAAGTGASSFATSWVELLRARLLKDKKIVNVVNLASGGAVTYDIMSTKAPVPPGRPIPFPDRNITAALKHRPFLVIISMPTNDIASNFTDDEILNNFKTLCSDLDSAHVNYILTGTQPRNFSSSEQENRLLILNNKLIKAFPNHVVDILKKLSKGSNWINDNYAAGDGVHLNDKGHRIIYSYILKLPLFQNLFGYHY